MGSLILPSATAALAYKRLGDIVDRLQRKVNTTSVSPEVGYLDAQTADRRVLNDPERRVLALAVAAKAMFEGGETIATPGDSAIPPGMSKFALFGATAYEWPRVAQVMDGESWVAETMRRGNPDANRSNVYVDSTDFALEVGRQTIAASADADEEAKARAFAMGVISATASQVLVSPVLRGLHESRTNRTWKPIHPGDAIARAENRVRTDFFGGLTSVGFQNWLPSPTDVPASIHDGYLAALEATYGIPTARPPGLAEYEAAFVDPGPLTADGLRSSQSLLVQHVVTATWGPGTWWLVLSPGLLAVPLTLLIGKALPSARFFFEAGSNPGERGAYEILTLGMGLGSLAPLGWSSYLWSQVPDHTGTFVWSLIWGVLRIGLTIGSLATHGSGLDAGARWGGFYAPYQTLDLVALIGGIVHAVADRSGDAFVWFLNTFPTMVGTTALLFAELMKLIGLDDPLGYWLTWSLLTVAFLTAVGLPVAFKLASSEGISSLFTPDPYPPLNACLGVVSANPAGSARLFDDSTLWPDGATRRLDDLRYPPRRRGLIRVWWEGDGDLTVNADDRRIELRVDGSTLAEVELGLADLSTAELANLVEGADPGLSVSVIDDDLEDLPFPFPHALRDPGDDAETLADHAAGRLEFIEVGTDEESAYVVFSGPQSELTTPFGLAGVTASGLDDAPLVPRPGLGDGDHSAVGLAAELAAVLCLGAAPTLAETPIEPPEVDGNAVAAPVAADEVHQIFRRWNLDDRRINEWRMLVAGNARSEKPGADPAVHDPGMRAHPNPAGYASPAPGGHELANRLGWLPTWRAWLRMAADVTSDSRATTAEAYTPRFVDPSGVTRQPTNAELTEAVRFLLDLP